MQCVESFFIIIIMCVIFLKIYKFVEPCYAKSKLDTSRKGFVATFVFRNGISSPLARTKREGKRALGTHASWMHHRFILRNVVIVDLLSLLICASWRHRTLRLSVYLVHPFPRLHILIWNNVSCISTLLWWASQKGSNSVSHQALGNHGILTTLLNCIWSTVCSAYLPLSCWFCAFHGNSMFLLTRYTAKPWVGDCVNFTCIEISYMFCCLAEKKFASLVSKGIMGTKRNAPEREKELWLLKGI